MKSLIIIALFLVATTLQAQTLWLDQLDLSPVETGWGTPHAGRSVDDHPLTIAGKEFSRGVGTHAVSTWLLHLDAAATQFHAVVGVDDEIGKGNGSVEFFLLGDRKVLWQSGPMKKGDPAKTADVGVRGVTLLGLLVTDAGDGIDYDHADWADARIEFSSARNPSEVSVHETHEAAVLTPPEASAPRINGARIFGIRPGHPLQYTIAASGARPMSFEAEGLPDGASLDPATGVISGVVRQRGSSLVGLTAKNALGEARAVLRLLVGDTIALTPPMGWNSWNCWAEAVDDGKVRASADAFVRAGLVNHGWSYINIDDCWMVKPGSTDSLTKGEPRDPEGMIHANAKFPSMHALSDYVHSKGLKLGIYSSPGTLTCAGYAASYNFESQDARQYAEWGIDYLKYDWCSYERIAKDHSLPELKKPYFTMRSALNAVPRDIVFSLCQYGMGDVWQWGAEVGGNCWRTTGDITDTWSSMSTIGFNQAGHELYAGPGHWNDPDMLVVGNVGWGPSLHPSRLTPDEQYTHISLWCLLSAPLLIGCDLSHLDDFTKNLLTNDEVLAVDQDELGKQASRVSDRNGIQVWAKELADGSKAVGIFNTGIMTRANPADYFRWDGPPNARVEVKADELGFARMSSARDLWRQRDLPPSASRIDVEVPYHGVVLLKITGEER